MALSVGDKIPHATLTQVTSNGPQPITTEALFEGKKVVLFAVPGAFTPTCSASHLPGYITHADAIKSKGVDTIACVSVNDAFVMGAWGENQNMGDEITLLADGSGDFTRTLGLEFDLSARGLGVRSQRYALVAQNGEVKALNIDEGGALDTSAAEKILESL